MRDKSRRYIPNIAYTAVLFVISFIYGLIRVVKLNVPPVTDEVSSMANAAFLAGYDWSETVFASGSYYFKYGAAVLYYPLFALIKDPVMLYRACLALNIFFFALIPVFAFYILKRHLNTKSGFAFLLALTTALAPSTLLNTLYCKADAMLIFLCWPVMLVILELMKAGREERSHRLPIKRIGLSVLLGALTMYAYMCHTRGIIFLPAVLLTLLLARIMCRERTAEWFSLGISGLAVFLIDRKLTAYFYDAVYAKYGTMYSSTESYDFASLKLIFTRPGLASFAKTAVGTAYNILVSSYGLAAVALVGGIWLLIAFLRRRSAAGNAEVTVTLFSLLIFLGTGAMSVIYFFPYTHQYYTGVLVDRADWLVYGRYIACSAGPAIMLGLYLLLKKRECTGIISRALACLIYIGCGLLFITKCAPYMENVSGCVRYYITLAEFVELSGRGLTVAAIENIVHALTYAGIVGLAVMILLLAATLRPVKSDTVRLIAAVAVFAAASCVLTQVNYDKIRLGRDEILMEWISAPVEVLQEAEAFAADYPVIIDDTAKAAKHYQFLCPQFICCGRASELSEASDCFIVARRKYFLKELYDDDYYTFDSFDYDNAVKDIVYVKGDKLAAELEKAGFRLSKYKGKLKKSITAEE